MKKLFSILIAGLSLTAVTTPAQAELSADGTIAVAEFDKLEACMQDFVDALAGIQDKESADAGAALLEEKIAALQQQMMAMQQLESKLKGIPTEDDKAAFEASRERLHTIGANLQQELMRLSLVNFYYSETLINTFKKLQGGMR
ncbi:MAG: hypothetical protein E7033_03635 [Akkermansiaceae bacterium]|nr:hypothetical protein [Akkermansiaceae bacterium]